eukprot:scaffold7074_cov256-Pinguiococcus_pyrenoidosus.AAC.5
MRQVVGKDAEGDLGRHQILSGDVRVRFWADDGLAKAQQRLRRDKRHARAVSFGQVLQAVLQVQLADRGDDVLSLVGERDLHGRLRLIQLCEALLKEAEVALLLRHDSDANKRDRLRRERRQARAESRAGQRGRLRQHSVDASKGDGADVARGNRVHVDEACSHHQKERCVMRARMNASLLVTPFVNQPQAVSGRLVDRRKALRKREHRRRGGQQTTVDPGKGQQDDVISLCHRSVLFPSVLAGGVLAEGIWMVDIARPPLPIRAHEVFPRSADDLAHKGNYGWAWVAIDHAFLQACDDAIDLVVRLRGDRERRRNDDGRAILLRVDR